MKRSVVRVHAHPPFKMRFILGPLLVAAGIAMMRYTVELTNISGKIDFAEKYLGGGLAAGTYSWWRLVGLFLCIIGALWFFGMLGVIGDLLVGILGMEQ
jgi:hypothetical protein